MEVNEKAVMLLLYIVLACEKKDCSTLGGRGFDVDRLNK